MVKSGGQVKGFTTKRSTPFCGDFIYIEEWKKNILKEGGRGRGGGERNFVDCGSFKIQLDSK
jgi:hypothetical protein